MLTAYLPDDDTFEIGVDHLYNLTPKLESTSSKRTPKAAPKAAPKSTPKATAKSTAKWTAKSTPKSKSTKQRATSIDAPPSEALWNALGVPVTSQSRTRTRTKSPDAS